MNCLLGQLCWTGKQTFLSSSIHLQWQAAQVAGRSAIVIFPEAIWCRQRGGRQTFGAELGRPRLTVSVT